MTDAYDNGSLACGPDHLEIRGYYFPWGTKRIAYARIQGLHRFEITGVWSGKWRLWGTGNPRYWANLDLRRPRKKVGFVVDLGGPVSPVVSPDDPDAFESAVRERAHLAPGDGREMKGPFI